MSNDISNVVLEAIGLEKTYQEAEIETEVFSDIDFKLKKGEKVAIVGASGSGKSTLLHLLAGLDSPNNGSVMLNGESFSEQNDVIRGKLRNRYMGFVYQFHHLFSELTALENVMMPLQIRRVSNKEATAQAKTLLEKVGLADRALHKPSELSGGERQRVAIARALITNPTCILADEPTGNLDYMSAGQVFNLLLELNNDLGTALLIVTHDRNLAAQMDRQVTLLDGRLTSS